MCLKVQNDKKNKSVTGVLKKTTKKNNTIMLKQIVQY